MRSLSSEDLKKESQLAERCRFVERQKGDGGDVVLLEELTSRSLILMKEKVFYSREEFTDEFAIASALAQEQSPHVARLLDFATRTRGDARGTQYAIRLFYEGSAGSLRSDIAAWRAARTPPTTEEMTLLVFEALVGLNAFESKGIIHAEISPDSLAREPNGWRLRDRVRSAAPVPQNLVNRFLLKENCYFAPEVIQALKHRDAQKLRLVNFFKADVFAIGLVALEAGTLTSTHAIEGPAVQALLDVFEGNYQDNPLLCRLLRKMLHPDDIVRPSAYDLVSALPPLETIRKHFEDLRQLRASSRAIPSRRVESTRQTPPSEPQESKRITKPSEYLTSLFMQNDQMNSNAPETSGATTPSTSVGTQYTRKSSAVQNPGPLPPPSPRGPSAQRPAQTPNPQHSNSAGQNPNFSGYPPPKYPPYPYAPYPPYAYQPYPGYSGYPPPPLGKSTVNQSQVPHLGPLASSKLIQPNPLASPAPLSSRAMTEQSQRPPNPSNPLKPLKGNTPGPNPSRSTNFPQNPLRQSQNLYNNPLQVPPLFQQSQISNALPNPNLNPYQNPNMNTNLKAVTNSNQTFDFNLNPKPISNPNLSVIRPSTGSSNFFN